MTLYAPPSLRFLPRRMAFSTWVDHLPFGYDLVEAVRPEVLVELGTQSGVSYFCFCQSVRDHGLSTKTYAVDTWRGDAHTQAYDEQIWTAVREHHERNYADFSTLLRMLFEEAATRFPAESIDLLHIDGYHTYDAVRSDFELFYPKVKPGGIVLFHDIAARLLDFGAWRFWSELETSHETFWFKHGFGLGVLRKPGPRREAPLLDFLFSGDEAVRERLRAFYVHAAEHAELLRKKRRLDGQRGSGG
ncbi:MAG TPA: class I SAM-dependent methyltransferase [Polyangiaceae bacterium]|nr:class I SAM-dependent methyltransferase [Polyangiaceae bacterium]